MLGGERAALQSELDSLNEEIELLELEEEASNLESDIAKLTVEKAVSQDYLDLLREKGKAQCLDSVNAD